MKSLADVLGVADSDDPTRAVAAFEHRTGEDFARDILNSKEYRDSLYRRIRCDELSPVMERALYEYAYGKPVTRVEVKDTSELANMTYEQLAERAEKLREMAKRLGGVPETTIPPRESVH